MAYRRKFNFSTEVPHDTQHDKSNLFWS